MPRRRLLHPHLRQGRRPQGQGLCGARSMPPSPPPPRRDQREGGATERQCHQVVGPGPSLRGLPEPVDVFWTAQNYHDLFTRALEPGRRDGRTSRSTTRSSRAASSSSSTMPRCAGSPVEVADKLHRIDPAIVKQRGEPRASSSWARATLLRKSGGHRHDSARVRPVDPRQDRPVRLQVPASPTRDRRVAIPRIAFIGLGNMGGGMAANQAKAGREVAAFDLSPPALDRAKAAGCAPAAVSGRGGEGRRRGRHHAAGGPARPQGLRRARSCPTRRRPRC